MGVTRASSALRYVSGNYYVPDGAYIAGTGGAAAAGVVRLAPGYVRSGVTVSSLSVRVTTLAAGGLFQLSVYAADPASLLPTGAPLYTSASQSTAATGLIEITGLSLSLPKGLYWFAVQVDTTGAAATFTGMAGTSEHAAQMVGLPTTTNLCSPTGNTVGYTKTGGTFGTWPTLTGNGTTDSLNQATSVICPIVGFKVA